MGRLYFETKRRRRCSDIVRKREDVSWGAYLSHGIGTRLSFLGERTGQRWLIYNPLIFARFHALARGNAEGVLDCLDEIFPRAMSLADVGAGTGTFSKEAQRRDRTVMACEHSRVARLFARLQGIRAHPFDLAQKNPIGPHGYAGQYGPFDLTICLEVGEHLPPELGDRLVDLLSQLSSTVVFSAAAPGQGGIGHINEQSRAYWLERFADRSLYEHDELTKRLKRGFAARDVSQFLVDNVMVLQKASYESLG